MQCCTLPQQGFPGIALSILPVLLRTCFVVVRVENCSEQVLEHSGPERLAAVQLPGQTVLLQPWVGVCTSSLCALPAAQVFADTFPSMHRFLASCSEHQVPSVGSAPVTVL